MLVRTVVIAVLLVSIAVLAGTQLEKFTGAEDHSITLEEAALLTYNYQAANEDGIKSHFFGRQAIEKILEQDGAVGVRVYYGLDDEGMQHLVMVGADANQDDLVDGFLAQRAPACPPSCGVANDLNSAGSEHRLAFGR